jgi:hypothetical protein
MMVDRFFPGRTAQLRASTQKEINATTVIMMDIERASAKIRAKGVADDDEDYALPIYAERLPVRTVIGMPEPCPRLQAGVERPHNLDGYRAGRPLEEAVTVIGHCLVQEPTTMPWGNRSLLFRDPDGTLVNFFTPIRAEAIKKFAE